MIAMRNQSQALALYNAFLTGLTLMNDDGEFYVRFFSFRIQGDGFNLIVVCRTGVDFYRLEFYFFYSFYGSFS